MPAQPLTANTVEHLHAALAACNNHAHVKWATPTDPDTVRTGTARRIGAHPGHELASDIRDQFLHVSSTVEQWLPMEEVLQMLTDHTMVFTTP